MSSLGLSNTLTKIINQRSRNDKIILLILFILLLLIIFILSYFLKPYLTNMFV